MTGLTFFCGIAALFVLLLFWEKFESKQNFSLRPAGLLQWLVSGNWPAKVGATLLIISTGALLRYLIVNIDLPPSGKLSGGIIVAAILGGISAYLHNSKKRRAIHLALAGAAFGVAYLTAYSAYGYFHFIGSIEALGALFIVACAATFFALESGALSIAILSMAGAFIAPAFALSDSPSVLPVYGYYVLASSLVLMMVALQGWRPLIHLSFLFTLAGALFFGWTAKFYEPNHFAQMHPLLLCLVAIHLLMPLLEFREKSAHNTPGIWRRRFDTGYFILLPIVSALLMLLLAPNDAVEGALGLLELAALWSIAAGIQYWRFGAGVGRYGMVSAILALLAALLAIQDVPYILMAASVASLILAGSRTLQLSNGKTTACAIAALAFSACYIVKSLLEPTVAPAFLNGAYLCCVILSGSLLLSAYGAHVQKQRTFTSVYLILAFTWFVVTSARELVILNLTYLPQLVHLAVLAICLAYAVMAMKRKPNMAITLLLGFSIFLSAMFCSKLLTTPELFAALLTGQFVFLAIAHAAGKHQSEEGEAIAGITRSLLPVLMFPFVGAYAAEISSAGGNVPHMAVIMSFLVSSALLASLHAQVTMPEGRFWPNTLSPVGFIVFGFWLFYQTLFHIERSPWAVAYEVIALIYIVQTVLSLQRSRSQDIRLFSIIGVLAVACTSAAMFLRAFGPPGPMTIMAINDMLLPAVVSLFWAIIGGLITWWATRIQSRWWWAAGSLLLIFSAVKLVLFDFGSLGQLGNIIAMMAAGAVFMAVAWLAPFPPKREETTPEASDYHEQTQPDSTAQLAAEHIATTDPIERSSHVEKQERRDTPVSSSTYEQEDEGSNRTWLWVLAGLVLMFFVYHSAGRGRTKPHVSPTVQTANEPVTPAASAPAPLDHQDYLATSHKTPRIENVCTRFVDKLPANYEIYAAGGYHKADPRSIRSGNNTDRDMTIEVNIDKRDARILLILGSNEFVKWKIKTRNNAKIIGIISSGQVTSMIYELEEQVPILYSANDNGAPCGYFSGSSGYMQRAHDFTIKLLSREVDSLATPNDGKVFFGVNAEITEARVVKSKALVAPYGITCEVPQWNNPKTSCSGEIIASGSMKNSDDPDVAARNCQQAGVAGSCCMYHLYGVGKWYVTNGLPQNQGRDCETEPNGSHDSCYAGGSCTPNQPIAWTK